MDNLYQPTWNSLKTYPTPKWLQDAKFGIYTHWGVYSVPACGPNVSWYPHNMYREGTPQHEYHIKTYGAQFGYKDFIPMFTGEKFDPEEWAEAEEQEEVAEEVEEPSETPAEEEAAEAADSPVY